MNNGATIDKDSRRETAHASGSGFGGAAASGWGAHREADSSKNEAGARDCSENLRAAVGARLSARVGVGDRTREKEALRGPAPGTRHRTCT